jgi:hypothetical protein
MNNHDNGRARGVFHAVAMIVAFVCAASCALAVALGAGAVVAHADETGQAGGTGTIELKYEYQGESLEGDGVSLYRVADWDGGVFTLRDEYADAGFGTDSRGWDGLMDDLKDGKATAEQFQTAANTLDAYVRAEGIEPTRTGTIYGLGASFSGVDKGLYLVVYDRFTDAEKTCGSSASLVSVPANENGTLVSDVQAYSKSSCEATPESPRTTRVNVTKVWKGDTQQARPESIKVQLIRDGEVYDTATLDAGNNWKHSWGGLDASHDWLVREKSVPKGYAVAVERDSTDVTITNTATEQARTGLNVTVVAAVMVAVALVAFLVLAIVRARRDRA